jgi:branched-chain amino acid transport system ATP-binding protein
MSPLLDVKEVSSGYGRTQVLQQASLTIEAGEIVALIGANGAGKTTLLNTIMGLVPLTAGKIIFAGRAISGLPTPEIVRAGLAQVPERRQLFGAMTVEENLRLGAYSRSDGGVAASLHDQFEQFPILRERRGQAAFTLSGGEQQMVAIARAMMSRPRLLLLDEPSLGLAPLMVARILEQITALRHAGGTVLVVEQNARAALTVADRGYVLENGRIVLHGSAGQLLDDPAVRDAYLGGEGGASGGIEGRIRAKKRTILGR